MSDGPESCAADVRAWIDQGLASLIGRARQPLLPPPYPLEEKRHARARSQRSAADDRKRAASIATAKRDGAEARRALVDRFRRGTRVGYVPDLLRLEIERMGREVFAADDPVKALRSLLNSGVDGRKPGHKLAGSKATTAAPDGNAEFRTAVRVSLAMMVGLSKDEAVNGVAGSPEGEAVVRNIYDRHRLEARAFVASQQELPTLCTWDGDDI